MKHSAGILVYRKEEGVLQVFLVHPGGPYWAGKDLHCWSIPKGELEPDEEPFQAALREFTEETGFIIGGDFISLQPVKQPGGKLISIWAMEGNFNAADMKSNMLKLKWPPLFGKIIEFPEVDKGEWFDIQTAGEKIFRGQKPFLNQLVKKLSEK